MLERWLLRCHSSVVVVKFWVLCPVIVTVVICWDVMLRILVPNLFYFDLGYFFVTPWCYLVYDVSHPWSCAQYLWLVQYVMDLLWYILFERSWKWKIVGCYVPSSACFSFRLCAFPSKWISNCAGWLTLMLQREQLRGPSVTGGLVGDVLSEAAWQKYCH